MPKPANPKCRQCSKLSLEQALQLHGPEGDGCWTGSPLYTALDALGELDQTCHKRRSWYRNHDLYNRNRRLKYRGEKESPAQLVGTPIPSIPAVMIYLYRERKDSELHALGSVLWLGQQRRDALPPVHTFRWSEAKAQTHIQWVVEEYARKHELKISGIAGVIERHPSLCPLVPCPFKEQLAPATEDGSADA